MSNSEVFPERNAQIVHLRSEQHLGDKRIGALLKVSPDTVRDVLERYRKKGVSNLRIRKEYRSAEEVAEFKDRLVEIRTDPETRDLVTEDIAWLLQERVGTITRYFNILYKESRLEKRRGILKFS